MQAASGRPALSGTALKTVKTAAFPECLDFKFQRRGPTGSRGSSKNVELQYLDMHTALGTSLDGCQKFWLVLDHLKNENGYVLVKEARELHTVTLINESLPGIQTAWQRRFS